MLDVIPHRHAIEAGIREPSLLEQPGLEFEAEVVASPTTHVRRNVDPRGNPSPFHDFVDEEAGGAANVKQSPRLRRAL